MTNDGWPVTRLSLRFGMAASTKKVGRMNYNTNRFGNSLDTTKFSTHAERDVLAVSFAFFCSGFGQADRVVRFGHCALLLAITLQAEPPAN